jgi:[glutamine synthetase] adenylyltransferase / [glutamine synthetase]-adenylyl-L-tyrosine phosphorylase
MRRSTASKRPKPRGRRGRTGDGAQKANEAALVACFSGMLPRPAAESSARVTAWLAGLEDKGIARSLAALMRAHRPLTRLLRGIAEASPYLWELVQADPARFIRLLESAPDRSLALILAEAQGAAAHRRDDMMHLLRRLKTDAALLIALVDIGGVWPVARVTDALTELADTALKIAVDFLLREAAERKQVELGESAHPAIGSGYIVLAMGKLGGRELNFSSDVDLIVFFDAAAAHRMSVADPAQFYVRLTRDLVKILQERTPDGYVFRVDLRLRPDPSSTQIAISTVAALDYYESRGQNWERAALIKARPCAGDLIAGDSLVRDLAPFVWRKYLDYATVIDIHELKRQIHTYRGHGEIAVEGHNIKLGRGGIREIEFFTQTQQLIAGGRHPVLRGRGTVSMLAALAAGGWIDVAARDELTAAYEFLRRVEHRLQMIADEQTHTLPADPQALGVFARFLGFKARGDFAEALLAHLNNVERHYMKLFERDLESVKWPHNLSLAAKESEGKALERLAQLGFRRPQDAARTLQNWQAGGYRALRGEQARANLVHLLPVIIDEFSRSENPDGAFAAFDRFLGGLRAGGRFLSLLRQKPELMRFIALILGLAPRLADSLAQHPHFIDPLVDPSFFGALPDEKRLQEELAQKLGETSSYEDVLDAIRLFGQQHMFLIGARVLSASVAAEQAGEAFARLADVLLRGVQQKVAEDFILTHGRIRGGDAAILALGRLGALEMTASSDLDLIVIYDFDPENPKSDGGRPLDGAQYFARFTQRLISALTVRTNYGALYQVDMRLRPSGRSGPLATRIESFRDYQQREAWTWEHMALTRARVVSGSAEFAAKIQDVIRTVLCRRRDAATVAGDVVEMRIAIAREKGDANPWDLKYAAGGLVDIEFIAQYLQLVHAADAPDILDTSTTQALDKAARLGVLKPEDAAVLRPAVRLFHDLAQILRVCLPTVFDPKTASAGVLNLLARAADLPDFSALEAHLIETQRQVRQCFTRVLQTRDHSPA